MIGSVKYGVVDEIDPRDYGQRVRCDDGSIDFLLSVDRAAGAKVGDRVKLEYRRFGGGALWFGSKVDPDTTVLLQIWETDGNDMPVSDSRQDARLDVIEAVGAARTAWQAGKAARVMLEGDFSMVWDGLGYREGPFAKTVMVRAPRKPSPDS